VKLPLNNSILQFLFFIDQKIIMVLFIEEIT
jgi:hypothetical protein